MAGADTIDVKVAELASELGWPGEPSAEDGEALARLLDDEFERLDVNARDLLTRRLAGSAGVTGCPTCSNLYLDRYLPEDGRCLRLPTYPWEQRSYWFCRDRLAPLAAIGRASAALGSASAALEPDPRADTDRQRSRTRPAGQRRSRRR